MISGREALRADVTETLVAPLGDADRHRTIALAGAGGVGKTSMLAEIAGRTRDRGVVVLGPHSLSTIDHRSPIGLLTALALDRADLFEQYLHEVTSHARLGRDLPVDSAQRAWLASVERISDGQLVVALDDIDTVGRAFRQRMLDLFRSAPQISILLGCRHSEVLDAARVVPVLPFNTDESAEVLTRLGVDSVRALEAIEPLCLGNALLLATSAFAYSAIDWSDVEGMSIDIERLIRMALDTLPELDRQSIALLSTLYHRIEPELLAVFTQCDIADAEAAISRLRTYPFIVRVNSRGARLHDLVREKDLLPSTPIQDDRHEILRRAVSEYYGPAATASVDRLRRNRLTAEMLSYVAEFDPGAAIGSLKTEVEAALARGDHDEAEALLGAQNLDWAPSVFRARARLLEAALRLAQLDPRSASALLDEISNTAHDDPHVRVEELRLRAACVVGPSPLPHGDRFSGVQLLQEACELMTEDLGAEYCCALELELANALRSVGMHASAESRYGKVADRAIRFELHNFEALAHLELSQLFRLQQDLASAERELDLGRSVMLDSDAFDSRALLHYYAGNLYRDSGRFDEARKQYRRARVDYDSGDDRFGECCVLGDWAWLEYLVGDVKSCESLHKVTLDLASRYRFLSELAEYWHTNYHIQIDSGDDTAAYASLAEALGHARRSTNVYMILDCLNHEAQRIYASREMARSGDVVERVTEIIREMQGIEYKGCGVRVFRHRAELVLGDTYFDMERYSDAYELWAHGLVGIAKFGMSRTNRELLEDLFASRAERLRIVVDYLKYHETLRALWNAEVGAEVDPGILNLCDTKND